MLGSNQEPLPCEVSTIVCWRFLELAKLLQISIFLLRLCYQCSPLFAWVGVKLVSKGATRNADFFYYCTFYLQNNAEVSEGVIRRIIADFAPRGPNP